MKCLRPPPEALVDQLRDHDETIESVVVLDGRVAGYTPPDSYERVPQSSSTTQQSQGDAECNLNTQAAIDRAIAQARQARADYLVFFSGSGSAWGGGTLLTPLNLLILPMLVLPSVDVRAGCTFQAVLLDAPSGQVVAVFNRDRHDNALATFRASKHGESCLLTTMLVRGSAQVAHDVTDYLKARRNIRATE